MYQLLAIAIQILFWTLPWPIRRLFLCWTFGYQLARTSRIGYSIILARQVVIGPGSRIGHLTMIRNLSSVALGECAIIGNFNKIAGVPLRNSGPFSEEPNRYPELVVGAHAALTNSHIIDCTNRVVIGEFATVAGWRCQILTHSIDLSLSRQRSAPVVIGAFSFVGTGCILLRGSVLPERSALTAGSVLASAESEPLWVYSGVPALKSKPIKPGARYFSRERGQVE